MERTPPSAAKDAPYPQATLIRALDGVIAGSALVMLFPLLLACAVGIRLAGQGPIFHTHRRIGRYGRSFSCLKFRTMVPDADARLREVLASDENLRLEWMRDHKLRVDPRITPIGRFLRKSSIDELPQLINVLRGEMSLVGPRPISTQEAKRYGSRYWSYCSVRPGLTGMWQISGRNHVRYPRRVAMDSVFARAPSLRLYLGILARTLPALLRRHGAY